MCIDCFSFKICGKYYFLLIDVLNKLSKFSNFLFIYLLFLFYLFILTLFYGLGDFLNYRINLCLFIFALCFKSHLYKSISCWGKIPAEILIALMFHTSVPGEASFKNKNI